MDLRGAAQAPQHVADMRAEDAAVHMRLVDDDEGQIGEHVAPRVMVGQDPNVEHVRIGENQVAPLADRGAFLARGVAVVDRRADHLVHAEGMQRTRLVLGQRLGRVQVESPRGPIGAQNLKGGELKAQRFARRRPRGDDRRSLEGVVQGLLLVPVEPVDANALQGRSHRATQIVGQPHKARGARPIKIIMHEPLIAPAGLEQLGPRLAVSDG